MLEAKQRLFIVHRCWYGEELPQRRRTKGVVCGGAEAGDMSHYCVFFSRVLVRFRACLVCWA